MSSELIRRYEQKPRAPGLMLQVAAEDFHDILDMARRYARGETNREAPAPRGGRRVLTAWGWFYGKVHGDGRATAAAVLAVAWIMSRRKR